MQAIAARLFSLINQLTKRDVSFVSVLMGLCQHCHADRGPRAELLLSQVVQAEAGAAKVSVWAAESL